MLLRSGRLSLVPRHSVIGEKSALYPLFAYVRLPSIFVGNLETTVILVHVARPYVHY